VLLAAGGDVERMLDPATGSSEAFVRHTTRMPFLKSGREIPLVAFAPMDSDVDRLLDMRQQLIDAVPILRDAVWLVYVTEAIRTAFLKAAHRSGGLFDAGGGITTWHVSYGPIGIVSGDTWLAGLYLRLEELLEPNPESGIVPVEPVYVQSSPMNHIPTTEPAPPTDPSAYDDCAPYKAVASRVRSPTPRLSYAPAERLTSSVPPNPRLRRN
jgi:hypothetical protein